MFHRPSKLALPIYFSVSQNIRSIEKNKCFDQITFYWEVESSELSNLCFTHPFVFPEEMNILFTVFCYSVPGILSYGYKYCHICANHSPVKAALLFPSEVWGRQEGTQLAKFRTPGCFQSCDSVGLQERWWRREWAWTQREDTSVAKTRGHTHTQGHYVF